MSLIITNQPDARLQKSHNIACNVNQGDGLLDLFALHNPHEGRHVSAADAMVIF